MIVSLIDKSLIYSHHSIVACFISLYDWLMFKQPYRYIVFVEHELPQTMNFGSIVCICSLHVYACFVDSILHTISFLMTVVYWLMLRTFITYLPIE